MAVGRLVRRSSTVVLNSFGGDGVFALDFAGVDQTFERLVF